MNDDLAPILTATQFLPEMSDVDRENLRAAVSELFNHQAILKELPGDRDLYEWTRLHFTWAKEVASLVGFEIVLNEDDQLIYAIPGERTTLRRLRTEWTLVRSKTRLNDHLLIENLKDREPEVLFAILNALGDQSADYMRTKAEEALIGCQQLLIATHVPPFAQAALYQEKPSGPEFAPHFVNVAMGDVLLDLAQRHQDKNLTILSGHTHHAARFSPLANLNVKVAESRYGHPAITEVFTL